MSIATHEVAVAKRDTGMQRAVDHADAVSELWSDIAYAYLFEYAGLAKAEGRKFLTEDVREHAEKDGFIAPTTSKAWGAVMRRGARNGLIEKCGYAPARSSNLSPKVRWCAV